MISLAAFFHSFPHLAPLVHHARVHWHLHAFSPSPHSPLPAYTPGHTRTARVRHAALVHPPSYGAAFTFTHESRCCRLCFRFAVRPLVSVCTAHALHVVPARPRARLHYKLMQGVFWSGNPPILVLWCALACCVHSTHRGSYLTMVYVLTS